RGGLLLVDALLALFKIDYAVGALAVHLGGGICGTLAEGLFGSPALLGTNLTWIGQTGAQLLGIVVCGVWAFTVTYLVMRIVNDFVTPLRIDSEGERRGLNVSEHGATNELFDLFVVMEEQAHTGDLSLRVPYDTFTEVGQIARRYNLVMDALEETVARTESIVKTAMDAIITFSRDDLTIMHANPAAEAVFGLPPQRLVGEPLTVLLGSSERGPNTQPGQSLRQVVEQMAADDLYHEITGIRVSGQTFPMEVALTQAAVGGRQMYTGTFRDITERVQAREELRQAMTLAEAASEAKTTFLANMSHELRTPLNAIIGYSELLINGLYGSISEGQRDRLDRILSNGRHLLTLINDVLDLSKIEAGRMELYIEKIEIPEMIVHLRDVVTPLMETNNNRLILDYADNVGSMVADLTKVRQILLNLLSNAAKFTEDGTVRLTAERVIDQGREWIVFALEDSGIGMTGEQLESVFEEFTQADASTTRRYGGTGLGLSISRRFTELMGGVIHAESTLGVGSTFYVRLPAIVSDGGVLPQPEGEGPEMAIGVGRGVVLVIDDDPDARDLLMSFLSNQGYTVHAASSGPKGIELARQIEPDIITLDVMMPEVDGWAVLGQRKADPDLADIPVVIVTMSGERNLGFSLGASEFLVKPVDHGRLLDVIERSAPREQRPDNPVILVVDDDPQVRDMFRDVLEAEDWMVSEAADGQAALLTLEQLVPDLVLLDLMMPHVDGFEFVRRMRQVDAFRSIPGIVVTAKTVTPADRERLNGYVQQVLRKGEYSQEELLHQVRDHIAARLRGYS
ncbi:MAG: response regulator, partial [Anaerolineae bacterium]